MIERDGSDRTGRKPLLRIRELSVGYAGHLGVTEVVRGVSLDLAPGECLGVVGESGSGKSQTFLALMGLSGAGARVRGSVCLEDRELIGLPERAVNRLRGARMAMIFQDPLTALSPHVRVGTQIAESLMRHGGLSAGDARVEARRWLDRVRIPDAAARYRQYPHELSGGMRQRVMIAAALAAQPRLLIADEPTTALDVTVQAEILDLLDELRRDTGSALVLITHDMGVVARLTDRICVMQTGRIVETGAADHILTAPSEPYTRRLLAAVPRVSGAGRPGRGILAPVSPDAATVLKVDELKVVFRIGRSVLRQGRALAAVDGVSFAVRAGETLGVVGESGSGKSTLSRAALRLLPADAGVVTLLGEPLSPHDRHSLQRARRDLQIVFQDPLGSLDPRLSVGQIVAEPLLTHRPGLLKGERRAIVGEWLEHIGLSPDIMGRYPHQLSGGQAQRVGIARAMVLGPRLVVCDEAVSALDVSIRAQVVDLLIALQARMGMAMLFISHDLAVVREVSHRILVMRAGRVVEEGATKAVLGDPRHAYTRTLLASVLEPDPAERHGRRRLPAEPASEVTGGLVDVGAGHRVAAAGGRP